MANLFIDDQPGFKKKFRSKFLKTKQQCPEFGTFINKLTENNTAFIVGGYLRDIQIGKESRDIDIIVDVNESDLDIAINKMQLEQCQKNRLGGYKLKLKKITVDFWSIEANWAFKSELVKRSEKYILERIGKGCFYNFDSLVIDIKTLGLNVKSFNDCVSSNQLDILMSKPKYRNLNPTKQANILRAFYLKKQFGFDFSESLFIYLKKQIYRLETNGLNATEQLLKVLDRYEKYKTALTSAEIEKLVIEVKLNKAAFSGRWSN